MPAKTLLDGERDGIAPTKVAEDLLPIAVEMKKEGTLRLTSTPDGPERALGAAISW